MLYQRYWFPRKGLFTLNTGKRCIIFLRLFIFNWRIIALQYCIGFCHTSTWISHKYNMSPSSWTSLPLPTLPTSHPISPITEHWYELAVSNSKFPLAIYLTYGNIYRFLCCCLNFSHPLLPCPIPQCPQVHSLCLHLHSCLANWFISTIFLDSIYFFLFLSYFTLYNRLCVNTPL